MHIQYNTKGLYWHEHILNIVLPKHSAHGVIEQRRYKWPNSKTLNILDMPTMCTLCWLSTRLNKTLKKKFTHLFFGLGYCNSVFTGLFKLLLKKRQLIQNAAARVLTETKRVERSPSSQISAQATSSL